MRLDAFGQLLQKPETIGLRTEQILSFVPPSRYVVHRSRILLQPQHTSMIYFYIIPPFPLQALITNQGLTGCTTKFFTLEFGLMRRGEQLPYVQTVGRGGVSRSPHRVDWR